MHASCDAAPFGLESNWRRDLSVFGLTYLRQGTQLPPYTWAKLIARVQGNPYLWLTDLKEVGTQRRMFVTNFTDTWDYPIYGFREVPEPNKNFPYGIAVEPDDPG